MCRPATADVTLFVGDSCKMTSSARQIEGSNTVIVKFNEEYGSTVSLFFKDLEQAKALISAINQQIQYMETPISA